MSNDTQELQDLEELSLLLKKLPTAAERCQLVMSWVRSNRITAWQFIGLARLLDTTGFDLSVAHIKAQMVTWSNTPIPPEVALRETLKGVEALKIITTNLS